MRFVFALIAAVGFLAGLGGCDSKALGEDEPPSKLVGTWQRDFEFRGAKAHLVLSLGADRKFVERIDYVEPDGRTQQQEFAGEWSFDGVKFARRYLRENGRQYSGSVVRFATLDLTSVTSRQFTGKDNLRGEEFVFQRAP
ncbi:hypothetical protein [Caenimonas koreensis]|uniref:Lipocalin-like domain-containing protein n=1 Tax=Caenimonas koreensis DSM 17982 TaxID=1121255 RepID=A0A844AT80_9BURK|nr:hypothetical protein [Caenimonas koreensis]MRD47545.1 hypothetical protein [Caenimonas koreensis DSM 17982]